MASASAREGGGSAVSLHMREPPPDEARESPRAYHGPTAVEDASGSGDGEPEPAEGGPHAETLAAEPDAAGLEGGPSQAEPSALEGPTPEGASPARASPGPVTATVPPPSSVRDVPEHVAVAVGLGPQAPGTREERALLEALEVSVAASSDPTATTRHLRPGQGARRVCRERRDDLVVTIGYVADRSAPVVLVHDCVLDRALGTRAADAVTDPGLLGVLWEEHRALMREGVRERRRISLGPRARGGIIAGVVIVVVGVAVGALVANALREESVVITVRP
ncbi:MAG: hypothetical protein KDK70_27270 [Myxococcales bacterium]|nr:hypothetical protein [Myxococcales bacterium]